MRDDHEIEELLESMRRRLEFLEAQSRRQSRGIEQLLRLVWSLANRPHFTILITQETPMAIGNIGAGTSGTFAAQLEDNGSPIALPVGSTFAWTASDTTVLITPSDDSLSALIDVPSGDTGTSITVTASTVAPDGSTVSGSITVPLTPVPQQYSVTVVQTA